MGPLAAIAGAAMPKDEYLCYKKTSSGYSYSGWDLTIVDNEAYEFSDGETTETGKYRKEGKKLFFTKGYLKQKNFKGKYFKNDQDAHQVDLIKKGKTKPTYNCVT
jgi:hypothetical protein